MDQYSQPQPSFYQSEVAFEKTKNVIFETSPIKLILALVLPGVISGIIKAAQPLIIDWIVGYTDTNYSKWYSILLILNAVLIFALTCIVTFSLCKNKKEGIMILGLNFFVGSVLKIFHNYHICNFLIKLCCNCSFGVVFDKARRKARNYRTY